MKAIISGHFNLGENGSAHAVQLDVSDVPVTPP
jgi:hypothetical protein